MLAGRHRLHRVLVDASRKHAQHESHLPHGEHAAGDSGDLDHRGRRRDQTGHRPDARSGRRRSCPRWVSLASIAYIGVFHTAAGLSKLSFSGSGWATGTSLQLWTYLWGYRWSPTTQLILASRTFTQVLQVLTLVVETAGVLAIFPRLRVWIGLGLVGFYLGVLATFDYGFQFNALLTAALFLPLSRGLRTGQQAATHASTTSHAIHVTSPSPRLAQPQEARRAGRAAGAARL